jgi:predicted transcriptional regulator
MDVHLTPETEANLARSAARQGRTADEIAQEIIAHYFEEESRLTQAVKRGEGTLQNGEYLTHEEVGQRLKRFLEP